MTSGCLRSAVRYPRSAFSLQRKQSALPQHILVELSPQAIAHDESRIRRVSDAKAFDRFLIQTAPRKILPCMSALGTLQVFLKKRAGAFVNVEQHSAKPGFLGFSRTGVACLGQGNAEFLRNRSYR